MTDSLSSPITLPCGTTLKNRFLKSAMSEVLATQSFQADQRLATLYARWAEGGTGTLVTGNVMIDRRALGEPRNVVAEDASALPGLRQWAAAGTANNAALWMQINHPGKQAMSLVSADPVAPSAIPFKSSLRRVFPTPRALTESEILDLVTRFGTTASLAREAGFTGVQIHGAHGYLVNQFLSPLHNQRDDDWGGNAEKRRRFVLEVYHAMRKAVGKDFAVSIKLNSADFQRGGFTEEESLAVIDALVAEGMDLIEISGGTYEAPAMTGARQSTIEREAYFLAFAEKVRQHTNVPLAVTGGFRSDTAMKAALSGGALDVIGLARPLAIDPELPNKILAGESYLSPVRLLSTGSKTLDTLSMLNVTWYESQLARMAEGKDPKPDLSPLRSALGNLARNGIQGFQQRRAR